MWLIDTSTKIYEKKNYPLIQEAEFNFTNLWSISSTFYLRIFCTKDLYKSFFNLHATKEKLLKRLQYEKFKCKMLMKLTPVSAKGKCARAISLLQLVSPRTLRPNLPINATRIHTQLILHLTLSVMPEKDKLISQHKSCLQDVDEIDPSRQFHQRFTHALYFKFKRSIGNIRI